MRGGVGAASGRPRINVFTELPPSSSEAAGQGATWLPLLAARADVAVWTPQDEWDVPDAPGLTVRAFDPALLPARDLNAADATVFALGVGASPDLVRAALQVPGIVMLHDLPPAADLAAAERAIALVAHGAGAAAALRARTRLPVFHVPLAVRCEAAALGPAARSLPHRLVAFGGEQRLAGVLLALETLPRRGLFHLDAFGRVADLARARAVIERHGLHAEATLHGDAPAGAPAGALAAAGLGITLGTPPRDGAPAGLLRAWAHGLPVIADRADGAVLAVAQADDAEGIARHLMAFHADQDGARAVGRRGREIVRADHAPDRAAAALLAIAADAPGLHAGRAALDLARTAAAAMLEMVDAPTLRPTAPAVARAVAEVCGLKE